MGKALNADVKLQCCKCFQGMILNPESSEPEGSLAPFCCNNC